MPRRIEASDVVVNHSFAAEGELWERRPQRRSVTVQRGQKLPPCAAALPEQTRPRRLEVRSVQASLICESLAFWRTSQPPAIAAL